MIPIILFLKPPGRSDDSSRSSRRFERRANGRDHRQIQDDLTHDWQRRHSMRRLQPHVLNVHRTHGTYERVFATGNRPRNVRQF